MRVRVRVRAYAKKVPATPPPLSLSPSPRQADPVNRTTNLASCMAQPMMGMSTISILLRYLKGRGTKPESTRMSMKDVWLGT